MKRTIYIYMFLFVTFSFKVYAQSKNINSGWQFSEDKTTWHTINIPHTWNKIDAFDDENGYRRGFGYYKKQIFIASDEKNKIHYLKFNAVNQEATIYINGIKVGNHKGGYTAFNYDISDFINYDKYNLIEVTVDNSHNINIPPLDADFTFYGGIYMDVELISLPKQHFSLDDFASDGFYVNCNNVSKESATVEVTAILKNRASNVEKTYLRLSLSDAEGQIILINSKYIKLNAESSNTINIKLPKVKNPQLWSPNRPYLYQLNLVLQNESGKILDKKVSNVGFRWATLDPKKGFFLNGEPIKLIGVNRHQDYEGFGNAVPVNLQKKDIEIIKTMGANIIRFAHYPQTRELYDLCDKLGILVWTEIPIVNKVTDSDAFFEVSLNMQNENVKQYYNYPSVIMFGYMNEIFLRLAFDEKSTVEEKEAIKKSSLKLATQLENLTRKLAPNHITVMACHLNELYNETGIADLPMLLGWNLYFGWYDKDISDLGLFLDDQHKRYPNRSMLLSEYGPGADARIFTKIPKKFDFSIDYQAKLHQSYYKQITERPFMTGMTAWNFADFGSEFREDATPHINQKGIVQYDRTPKDIYYWYKSILNTKEPFVYAAVNYLSNVTLFGDEMYPIQVFSNQKQISIYLNGTKIKEASIENGVTSVYMPFVNGTNTIKVVSGTISEEKTIVVNRVDALDFKNFSRLGINIGSHFYFIDPEHQITFVPDQPYRKGWYGYLDGQSFGMTKDKNQGIPYNIKNSTSEPLFQTMLEDCSKYKVDVPKGKYKVQLFFVEPQIKATENIYNLSEKINISTKTKRIFDVYVNDVLIEKQFDMAKTYPDKYGIILNAMIDVVDDTGLSILLRPIEGKPVISGLLIEKSKLRN